MRRRRRIDTEQDNLLRTPAAGQASKRDGYAKNAKPREQTQPRRRCALAGRRAAKLRAAKPESGAQASVGQDAQDSLGRERKQRRGQQPTRSST